MLTWDEILALRPRQLRDEVERRCRQKGESLWLDYTGSWNACMPLAMRYGIDLLLYTRGEYTTSSASIGHLGAGLVIRDIHSEAAARLAICRLAVWAAQHQEDSHGSPPVLDS